MSRKSRRGEVQKTASCSGSIKIILCHIYLFSNEFLNETHTYTPYKTERRFNNTQAK